MIVGAKVQPLGTTIIREIEDYKPATATSLQMWKINGHFWNYADVIARYRLTTPGRTRPDVKARQLLKGKIKKDSSPVATQL